MRPYNRIIDFRQKNQQRYHTMNFINILLHIWKCWLEVLWGDNVLAKMLQTKIEQN